jgi:hypothetical protein
MNNAGVMACVKALKTNSPLIKLKSWELWFHIIGSKLANAVFNPALGVIGAFLSEDCTILSLIYSIYYRRQ